MRRLVASTYGPRQAQDTKAAFAAHGNHENRRPRLAYCSNHRWRASFPERDSHFAIDIIGRAANGVTPSLACQLQIHGESRGTSPHSQRMHIANGSWIFRVFSCAAKAASVPRASDADRRSRRRGDAGRRSPWAGSPSEVKGTTPRPSGHGVDAPSQAAEPCVRCAAISWSRVAPNMPARALRRSVPLHKNLDAPSSGTLASRASRLVDTIGSIGI